MNRRVYWVEVDDEPVHGSQADYRLPYTIGLVDREMKEMVLTTTERGEKVSNFKRFGEKDIVIGDHA
jgi:hypothetical protein